MHKWPGLFKDFLELWKELQARLQSEQLDLVVAVMKRIWYRRNVFIFKNKFEGPHQLFFAAEQGLEDFACPIQRSRRVGDPKI